MNNTNYEIYLNSIINIKVIHIISVMCESLKRKRELIENPIEGLMNTTMNSIKDMVDVNTIIGKPIETKNGIIIPLSKVTFGFASGGSEFNSETIDNYNKKEKEESIEYKLPFGGGSGAAVNISPIAFLVVQNESVKLLPIEHSSSVDWTKIVLIMQNMV